MTSTSASDTPTGASPETPVEVAIITAEAVGLITSTPVIDRALDGREVLLRGPLVSDSDVPAQQRAQREKLMVIRLSARQLLTIAQGEPVDVDSGWTVRGGAARVRLATAEEVIEFNRQARQAMTREPYNMAEDALPEPIHPDKAAELVEPITITDEQVQQLVDKFDPFHCG